MFGIDPQNRNTCTRRDWFKAAGVLSMGAAFAPQLKGSKPEDTPALLLQIGALLGTFRRATFEARFDAAVACGLECVQFSMGCAGLSAIPEKIPPELLARIRREAKARGLAIASLEGTFNMSHPDPVHRRDGLQGLKVLAEACESLGTSKIHLCTGTRSTRSMWQRHEDNDSPEAWHDMVSCVREATHIAEQSGVILAFEPEVNNVVDSPKKARRLMDEIGSAHLKVTMDAANIFHTGDLARMSEVLDQAFELIGKDIVLAHAKDLSHDGDAGHEPAGHGKLDYDRYLSLLVRYGFRGPLLLHGLSEAQVPDCVAFLRETLVRVTASESK